MVLNLSVPELKELKPKITVFGVGGAGGNAINNMISAGLAGVEFVAANTDAQALSKSLSDSNRSCASNSESRKRIRHLNCSCSNKTFSI